MRTELKFFVVVALAGASASAFVNTQLQLANQAEQLIRIGSTAKALEILQKAGDEATTAAGEDRIGFLYASTRHQEEALIHFRKSIADEHGFAPAHFHLGVILWLQKDQLDALQELQTAVQLDPKNFDYRYRLGSAYLDLDKPDEAIKELKSAAALDTTRADAWQLLGVAQERTNDLAAATFAFAKAVALKPGDDNFRNGYAQLLTATRQPLKAIDQALIILRKSPANVPARINLGYAYLKMGEYQKAEKTYQDLLALDPGSVAAHYDLGIAYKMQDQLEAAQKEFQKSIELEPTMAESHYTLGITNWQLGDFPNTIAEMKLALKIRPDYAEAHYMLGIALKQNGDSDAAIAELKEAIRLDPTTPGPYNTLGQILRIKGDKAGSEAAFANGTRLKLDKDKQLADSLDQGMRGNMMPKPMVTSK